MTNLNRRALLAALSSLPVAARRLFAQAATTDPHPVTNLDDHGVDMPAGMDMASDKALALNGEVYPTFTAAPVLTRSGGNLRHGVYQDATLTPASLVKTPLRKLFTITLPGDARGLEAQPLIASKIVAPDGTTHDVIISATMSNHVYCHDANDGTPLWMTRLGRPIVGTTKIDGWRINDKWGVLSTPVLDGYTLYVVSWSSPDGTALNAFHRLHAIRIDNGQQSQTPLALTKPGAIQRKQRASLTKVGTRLLVTWGTIQETSAGAHGFITKIDTDNWKITGELNLTANGSGAGIWQAGQGLAADDQFAYAMTGNGDYDGVSNFGESFVKIDLATLKVVDHWSPFRDKDRGNGGWKDQDLGSGGVVLIPELNLLVGGGKDGILFSLRADNLKAGPVCPPTFITFNGLGLDATPANVKTLDTLHNGRTYHMHGTPVYWQGKLWVWGENSNLRVGTIDKTGRWSFVARSAEFASPYSPVPPGGMPGSMLCLSANGNKDGIIWCSVPDGDANRQVTTGRVFAFDAQEFAGKLPDGDTQIKRLWMSDPHHTYNKFLPPVVSGGKLYLATYGMRDSADRLLGAAVGGSIEVWG